MGDFKDYIKSKNGIRVLVILFLLIAIPLTIYLVRQQQILKGKAAGEGSTLVISGSAGDFTPGSPPSTTSQFINLSLNFGPGGVIPTQPPVPTNPPPTTTTAPGQPTSTPVPTQTPATPTPSPAIPRTLTATPASVSPGQTVRVSWSGVNATDVNWFVGQYGGGAQSALYLGNCTTTAPAPDASIPSSGFCDFTAPSTPSGIDSSENPVLYYLLFHLTSNFLLDGAVTESNRVILITPTPTPTPITFFTPTPTPTDSPDDCGFGYHMCFRGISECVPFWEPC